MNVFVCSHSILCLMEKNNSIEQVLDNLDKNIVYKTKNSAWLGFLYMIPGIASMVIYSSFEWDPNNFFAQILFITGAVFLIIGILKCFLRKSKYVSADSHAKIHTFMIYFKRSEKDKLIRLLETGNLSELPTLQSSIVDGLKLRVMATKDGRICYSQVVAFDINEYVNATEVVKNSMSDYHILTEIRQSLK